MGGGALDLGAEPSHGPWKEHEYVERQKAKFCLNCLGSAYQMCGAAQASWPSIV